MKQSWEIGGETVKVEVSREGGSIWVEFNGQRIEVRGQQMGGGVFHLNVDGKPRRVLSASSGAERFLAVGATRLKASKIVAGRRRAAREDDGGLTSPMPGQVLKVMVSTGDTVAKGDTLMIIEAMKMEHAIKAPWDGVVTSVGFSDGDMVTPGAALAEVQKTDTDATQG